MYRIIVNLILIPTLLLGCNKPQRSQEVRVDPDSYELINNEITDNNYLRIMEYTRGFAIDSLGRNPSEYKYRLIHSYEENQYVITIELYDKLSEVRDDSPFNDSTVYVSFSNPINLHFDSIGNLLYTSTITRLEEE
jgi:hypothetical protein